MHHHRQLSAADCAVGVGKTVAAMSAEVYQIQHPGEQGRHRYVRGGCDRGLNLPSPTCIVDQRPTNFKIPTPTIDRSKYNIYMSFQILLYFSIVKCTKSLKMY